MVNDPRLIKNVVASSFSTYLLDQIAQLDRLGLLHTCLCGPPARYAMKFGIPETSVKSLVVPFALGYLRTRLHLNGRLGNSLNRLAHELFSQQLANALPQSFDLFIGMSAFSEQALKVAKSQGAIATIDHGSLHERFEHRQLQIEQEAFGFQIQGNSLQNWLVEKEDREFHQADHIAVLSSIAKNTLIENGVDEEKIWVNHPGVSLQMFTPHDKKDDVFRVAFCGQINPRKGFHYLLMALDKVRSKHIELWVMGPTEDIAQDKRFKKKLEEFDYLKIRYFGSVKKNQLAQLFSQCSVFVLPSLADGFGMVVTQAMASGLPVIVSDQTGAADLIETGKNGFVVRARDVDQLAERLVELFDDKTMAAEMGRYALASVASGLTWNDYGDRLAAILRERARAE